MTLPLQIIHQMNEQLKQSVRLPLEALVAKMATREQKASCVLQFAKTESVIRVQRAFHCNPPSDNNIHRWYRQFGDSLSLQREE